jgi:hypothetical protein
MRLEKLLKQSDLQTFFFLVEGILSLVYLRVYGSQACRGMGR